MRISPSAGYPRRARECLKIARTLPVGERRTVLLQLAQVWQRLADNHEDGAAAPPAVEGARPVVQQQQQVQPKEDE